MSNAGPTVDGDDIGRGLCLRGRRGVRVRARVGGFERRWPSGERIRGARRWVQLVCALIIVDRVARDRRRDRCGVARLGLQVHQKSRHRGAMGRRRDDAKRVRGVRQRVRLARAFSARSLASRP